MPAYLIVNYDVDDPDAYAEYQGGAAAGLGIGSAAQLRAFDPASDTLEGSPGAQTVVLEYESTEAARAAYDSEAYQAVVGTRLGATSNHFAVIVDGFG